MVMQMHEAQAACMNALFLTESEGRGPPCLCVLGSQGRYISCGRSLHACMHAHRQQACTR